MKMKAYPKGKSEIERIVAAFLQGETSKRCGNYFIEGNQLLYKTVAEQHYTRPYWNVEEASAVDKLRHRTNLKRIKDAADKGIIKLLRTASFDTDNTRKVMYEALVVEHIALRLQTGDVIGSSSVLNYIGRSSVFGRVQLNRSKTDIQDLLGQYVPMIPFSVFTEAKLDMNTFQVVERGPEEIVKVKRKKTVKKNKVPVEVEYFEDQHFTGASLFSVGSKTYLFDMDRRELEHGIVNPFVVEIPNSKECKTIGDAYNILMPVEVKQAIKEKRVVKRQGEWFFIPVETSMASRLEQHKMSVKDITLQAGPNRPNRAKGIQLYKGKPVQSQRGLIETTEVKEARQIVADSEFYVTGKVTHAGREHADLMLRGWFKAIPNTATNSFTITGDID